MNQRYDGCNHVPATSQMTDALVARSIVLRNSVTYISTTIVISQSQTRSDIKSMPLLSNSSD